MSIETEALAAFDVEKVESYRRADCAVFRKTAELWGEYSNMAGGFPIVVNGVQILTSEALYQACRFPHLPQVQREIVAQASPMAAKMKGKPHRKSSRADFDRLRVPIMWWALRVKLACNTRTFSRLLLASKDRPIVEDSHKDTFWGAKATKDDDQILIGQNVLGRLLGLMRDLVKKDGIESLQVVDPLDIPNFLLFGEPIQRVEGKA
jgi:type I restriction enzyme S subunit